MSADGRVKIELERAAAMKLVAQTRQMVTAARIAEMVMAPAQRSLKTLAEACDELEKGLVVGAAEEVTDDGAGAADLAALRLRLKAGELCAEDVKYLERLISQAAEKD